MDLKVGDILRITAANGTTTKDYFIDVLEYEAGFKVPATYAELVNLKMREQLWNESNLPGDIALAYYFELMRICGS